MAARLGEASTMNQQEPTWSRGLATEPGDRAQAETALRELFGQVGLNPPETVLWFANPFQGLLAHACLQHSIGPSLFRGDEPSLFRALMTHYRKWQKTASDYFPKPAWKQLEVGRRLSFRHQAVRQIMIDQALELVAGTPVDPVDFEQVRSTLGVSLDPQVLPKAVRSIGVHPGWSSPGYVRSFNFELQTSCGEKFTLRSPRCMDFDQVASTVYAVDKLSRGRPAWWAPLRELIRAGGWLWPFDQVALLVERPSFSAYDEEDRLHAEEAAALRYPDGRLVYFWQGEVVPERAIKAPKSLQPSDVLGEPDPEKRRAVLSRIGAWVIDAPDWPPNLQKLARMVFRRQYCRYSVDDVKSWARPRPEGVEPSAGCYYTLYPSGQLQSVFRVSAHGPTLNLRLEDGRAEGKIVEGSFAEQYYEDGRLEDFSPYDDTSPPYLTELSFVEWVEKALAQISGRRRAPRPVLAALPQALPAPQEQTLSAILLRLGQGPVVETRWQLQSALQEAGLDPETVHAVGTFGVAACRRVLTAADKRPPEMYLRADWGSSVRPVELLPLQGVELYREILALAQDEVKQAASVNKTPHWVAWLAGPSPVRVSPGGGLALPVEWVAPGPEVDRFWMTEVACELMLRQEASRGAELEVYLATVEREKFFRQAAIAAAFVQSAPGSGAARPGPSHPFGQQRESDLNDLATRLSASPLLPHHRGCHGSDGPFLTSLAEWVHRRVTGHPPAANQLTVVRWLIPFFNRRFETFPSLLGELAKGREAWELSTPVGGWPEPFEDDLRLEPGPNLSAFYEKLASRFFQATHLSVLRPKLDLPRFSRRLASAGCFLASSHLQPGETAGLADLGDIEGLPRVFAVAEWVLRPWGPVEPNLVTLLGHWMLLGL